jgi:hypothetical protein
MPYESRSTAEPERARRPILTASLLIAGLLIWAAFGGGRGIGALRWAIIAAATGLAMVPPVSRAIVRLLDRIRHPSPRQAWAAAIGIAIVAAGYFILTAFLQDRDLFAKTHDDCSYLIQMQMLARGHLWMPAHPLADFFDSFYLIVRPVYASQYFPGTALMYVPTIWLHLPTWVLPVLAAGSVVGLVYRILTELIDGAAGALGALWVVSLSWFRMASILLMSQIPALLLGLIMLWAWLHWRKTRRPAWLLLIGAAAGWAAITRPVDAVCYALPIGVAIVWDLLGSRRRMHSLPLPSGEGWGAGTSENAFEQPARPSQFPLTPALSRREREQEGRPAVPAQPLLIVALLLLGAAPFLGIQLAFDKGVTGHLFETPFRMYLDRDAPGTQFGFPKYNADARPQSVLPQKQAYYRDWVVPYIRRHQPDQLLSTWLARWLPMIIDTAMPTRAMIPLAIVGLAGLTDRRRVVLWATLPLFVLLYVFYTIFLEHYAIAVIPAMVLTGVLAVPTLGDALPRFRSTIVAGAAMLIISSCVTSLWEINRWIAPPGRQIEDETFRSTVLREVNLDVPQASDLIKPAVILFRYHPGDNYFEEPVYNTDVAWPDDAPIIRAHDLGPQRDREIIDYYATKKPVREFYLFDAKGLNKIEDLGPSDDPVRVLRKLGEIESRP